MASEIYASSFFDVSQRSRFISLVTAVEALLVCDKCCEGVQNLIDEFIRLTEQTDIDNPIKQSICGSVVWIRYESIGRAGRALDNRLLPTQTYAGKVAGAFFTKAYSVRSALVHNGTTDEVLDMLVIANSMEEFVSDLLMALLSSQGEA